MKTLKKVRKLLLYIEAFIFLGWARFLLYFPFSKISPSLGSYMQETSHTPIGTDEVLTEISNTIGIMSHHTFWESKCLVRAIAAMKMLERRKIESTLYLGTTKDVDGKLIAHAWLRSGSLYIAGFEEMERFTVVGKFARDIK